MTFIPITHTECIVLFLLQQWLCERATTLRYMYIVCDVTSPYPLNHLIIITPVIRQSTVASGLSSAASRKKDRGFLEFIQHLFDGC